jgi:hypothetical protein
MNIQARLIGIYPQTRQSDGSTFFSYSFATRKPIGLAMQQLVEEGLMTEKALAEMVESGLNLEETSTFTTAENDAILPRYVLNHVFNLSQLVFELARDKEEGKVIYHKAKEDNATKYPCINARDQAPDDQIIYDWVGVCGPIVRNLPPPPAGYTEVEPLPEEEETEVS